MQRRLQALLQYNFGTEEVIKLSSRRKRKKSLSLIHEAAKTGSVHVWHHPNCYMSFLIHCELHTDPCSAQLVEMLLNLAGDKEQVVAILGSMDYKGNTPLHTAIAHNQEEMVNYLIKSGAGKVT